MSITKQQVDAWSSDVDYWRKKYADLGLQYDALIHQAAQPDCRTCAFEGYDQNGLPCHRGRCEKKCTNGDKYEAAPAVVLWRTE